jgi:hypothetical protein
LLHQQQIEHSCFELKLKRLATEFKITVLKSEFKAQDSETLKIIEMEKENAERFDGDKGKMDVS